ncbi:hypothetical protein llap_7217 [Limosa lapponica baueri]|uniref:Uncharacterized protein n=1 Tax=Limosa lapponica baueri TaxID=1758121 RepID=A0A2I0U8T8_LIMLA|nr:hypothetical protein llap_7217 [Limosa lapponica baueri]
MLRLVAAQLRVWDTYWDEYWVILTNQITTSLSNGLAIQADLVSPADDLSLSEGVCESRVIKPNIKQSGNKIIFQFL